MPDSKHSDLSWIQNIKNGVLIKVWVQPGASKSEIVGLHGDPPRIRVRLAAPARDNEANEELIRYFSKQLKIPKSQIMILKGQKGKQKDLVCVHLNAENASRAFSKLLLL